MINLVKKNADLGCCYNILLDLNNYSHQVVFNPIRFPVMCRRG